MVSTKDNVLCAHCFTQSPEVKVDDLSIGGTYYGSKYSWHEDSETVTTCCWNRDVLLVEDFFSIETAKRFLRRFGKKGVINDFVEEIDLEGSRVEEVLDV